ncbi:PREDICTED: protein FAM83E [Nanorana parkeri]|uniref:protein FAM83E n=1 Tax=Nanorana parkeri TaxID=125878 RepID=UPI000855084F|nr:PREDICTED: protein FAM83E [Nanorana parkeri]
MANSQLKCLEDELEFVDITEASPQFYYSEKQRSALEILLSSGENDFQSYLKSEEMRPFLSREEVVSMASSAVDSQLGKIEYEEDSELDDDLSISYWPGKTDVPTPMLDLGWPEGDTWKGITRAEVYTHPPSNNAPHIKVVIRRAIQGATKVIAIVMDVFTDPDIFLDLHEAATRRMVPVYILLSSHHLSPFLHMVETTGVNVRFTEHVTSDLSGCSFSTKQLKQVTGKLKEKFLLIDSNSVITGSYSFTWTDSRLDRNLITQLTGEITDLFDNEFRTLFAASRPLQRYDFAKDPNNEVHNRLPIPSSTILVTKETENVSFKAQVVPVVPEPYTNGFSSPQRFTTNGALQPTDVLQSPYIIPAGPTQMTKSINKIAERRTVMPGTGMVLGMDSGYNRASLALQDSSVTKDPVSVPDYSIRHRLAACRNFEGPTLSFRTAQESHSALSDILKNVQRNRLSVAKTTGGRPSKSLWDLSQLSQLSGCSGDLGVRQNPLDLGEDSKHSGKRWTTKDTPAMLLMRQRAFPAEENRNRESSNLTSFQSPGTATPIRLQGQLVHGVSTTSLPRPWTNTARHGRLQYY